MLFSQNNSKSKANIFLIVFSISHALVDASCALLILGAIDIKENILNYVILYNVFAFGLQAFLGIIIDKYNQPKIFSILGILFLILAFVFVNNPLTMVLLAGIGNASFHIGGGFVALNIDQDKALYPAIYVAPGGIGLAIGIYLSKFNFNYLYLLFPILLSTMLLIIILTKLPTIEKIKKPEKSEKFIWIIILLILISITVRSLIGLSIKFPWKSDFYLLVILTFVVASGKVLGGIFADKFGWIKPGFFGLLLSIPLLSFGYTNPVLGLVGICIFNFTMPVTLIAISKSLPGKAGLSFGLTTMAILIGALPTFSSLRYLIRNEWVVLVLISISAFTFYFGLKYILKYILKNVTNIENL
jgi:MFS transporter, FSR family, fosmidomycin resistance protein